MSLLDGNRLREIVSKIRGKSALVIGDLMVDRYVSISARKLSREAPVPVGDFQKEELNLGGASNLANNIVALGGKANVVGFVGNDSQGEWIRSALDKIGVQPKHIQTGSRPTTLKTRYFVNGSQYLRVDREVRSDIDSGLSDSLLKSTSSLLPDCDIVAIADYDKGTITSYLVDGLVASAKAAGKKIIAQPKVRHYMDLRGVDYIKSNEREASIVTGISVLNESGLKNIATNLATRLDYRGLLLTRGEKGITVFEQNSMATIPPFTLPGEFARAVGIRDAMTSVMTLALASEANAFEAAALSNLAASKRAERVGTIVVNPDDIVEKLRTIEKNLLSIEKMPVRR
ncbi:MAG TPA: PfkB family carbohydrate kinase [Nitrososphaerales archaeon]|nr:PfkB family carbohydrate kinase [Nitrososphaerales archaeon]